MFCSMQLLWRQKQWAEKCKASLGRSSVGFGQFLLTCIRSHVSMAGSEFHSFCGLWHSDLCGDLKGMTYQTRRAWSQNKCATTEIKDASFFLRLHRIPVAYISYLCLNTIGLFQCFLDGPQKGPFQGTDFQWSQSLASISLEERCLKVVGSVAWWRRIRHKL